MTIFIEHFVYRKVYIHFIDKFEIVILDFFMRKLNYKSRRFFLSRIINLRKIVILFYDNLWLENSFHFVFTLSLLVLQLMHQWCWQPSDGSDLGFWEYFLPAPASHWNNICETVQHFEAVVVWWETLCSTICVSPSHREMKKILRSS